MELPWAPGALFPGVNHAAPCSFIPDLKEGFFYVKDRGLRFLCARVLPYPQITAQKEPKGRWELGRLDPP